MVFFNSFSSFIQILSNHPFFSLLPVRLPLSSAQRIWRSSSWRRSSSMYLFFCVSQNSPPSATRWCNPGMTVFLLYPPLPLAFPTCVKPRVLVVFFSFLFFPVHLPFFLHALFREPRHSACFPCWPVDDLPPISGSLASFPLRHLFFSFQVDLRITLVVFVVRSFLFFQTPFPAEPRTSSPRV